MATKVGRIPDLEYEPLYFDMARRGIEMSAMVPSQLAAAAAAGEIDAGPVPLVDCFQLEDRFQPVSGFCLACAKRAGKIFLYSKQPIEQLTGARIGITDETSTSNRKPTLPSRTPTTPSSSSGTGLCGSGEAHGVTRTPMTWEKNGTDGPAC